MKMHDERFRARQRETRGFGVPVWSFYYAEILTKSTVFEPARKSDLESSGYRTMPYYPAKALILGTLRRCTLTFPSM